MINTEKFDSDEKIDIAYDKKNLCYVAYDVKSGVVATGVSVLLAIAAFDARCNEIEAQMAQEYVNEDY